MGRLLIFALAVFALIWLLKRALGERTQDDTPRASRSSEQGGDLVRCARCGLHLPRAEAHSAGGHLYCSAEHARLGPGGA